jgi:UDP-N-acetylmuramate--alanine ligase
VSKPRNISELGRVHIVGIGGAGLSGLARLMLDRGIQVSGSDTRDSSRITALRQQGAHIMIGHSAENIYRDGAVVQTVVETPIIPDSVADLVAAREAGIPILSRAEALAIMLGDRQVIGVGGTHGKTTTTSMITVVLQKCGLDPSFAIGSVVNDLGSNAHTGSGEFFVVEADESDGAFLHMNPRVVVVTNLEADHLDYWNSFEELKAGFLEFIGLVQPNDGFAVICIDQDDSAELARVAQQNGVRVLTYGTDEAADYRIEVIGSTAAGYEFNIIHHRVRLGPLSLRVPGVHNAANATAAFAVCLGFGLSSANVMEGLASFSGARRRFEFRGQVGGIRVYDDYAHHPTEVTATLTAARELVGGGRLVVAFQAHHYFRTAMFSKEFGVALGLADEVVVLEVFAPGEDPIPGASGQTMAANVPLPPESVVFEPSFSAVSEHLAQRARPGDLIMTLGAGDISLLGTEVLAKLRDDRSANPAAQEQEPS